MQELFWNKNNISNYDNKNDFFVVVTKYVNSFATDFLAPSAGFLGVKIWKQAIPLTFVNTATIITNGTEGVLSTLDANGTGTVSTIVANGSERVKQVYTKDAARRSPIYIRKTNKN